MGYRRLRVHENRRHRVQVDIAEFGRIATGLDKVVERRQSDGLLGWRYHGLLVARQLDETTVVVRASFDIRDHLVETFPETFSVPGRFAKHMMMVADLRDGDDGAIEEAVVAAWQLQAAEG